MRIIQIIRTLNFGGAEGHCLTISLKLRERGHDVCVVGRDRSWIQQMSHEHKLPFEVLRMRGVGDIFSYLKLHRLIKEKKIDIVHGHIAHAAQYAKWAVKGTHALAIATAHSTIPSHRMQGCKHIVAVSNNVKENLIKAGYSENKITRIYNGVDDVKPGKRNEIRKLLGIPENQFAVLCAGRFQPDKGQDQLVEIAKLCSDQIHFYMMGNHETDFGQDVIFKAKGKNNIHFLGYRSNVQYLLGGFDLYAAPSRKEALSLSILEALAAKLPTVGMSVGGINESVIDGKTGLLASAGDIVAFANAVKKLANQPGLLIQLSENARLHYETFFTIPKMMEQLESLYESLRSH